MSDVPQTTAPTPEPLWRMDWRHAFFSLDGRLSRRGFWAAALVTALLRCAVYVLLAAAMGVR